MQTAAARNDVGGQIKALEGQLDSGFLPQSAQASYYRNLIGLSYKQPDYKKAIEYGQQLIKMGDTSPEVFQWVGQAYYELKDYKSAVDFFNNLVTQKEKAGRKPDRNELILLQSSYLKAGNKEAARATLQKVVKYYPDASTWQALLHDVKTARLDKIQKLQLYRLMQATRNLQQSQDYMEYSNAAIATGLLGESQQVLEAGLKANVFPAGADRDRAERYRNSAIKVVAEKKAELPALEAAAKASPTGDQYVELGMVYYSFGNYDKAAEALKAGIAKGKLKNPADARMNLGLVYLKSGQKAEALKAFREADSKDEVTQRIAELWALYAS
jgi:tetratricopeptide (TPR) repeat protein